jgi:hypothetical protein
MALASSSQYGRLTPLATDCGARRMRFHIRFTARQSVMIKPWGLRNSKPLATAVASPAATLSPGSSQPEKTNHWPLLLLQTAQLTTRTSGSLGCLPEASA